MATCPSIATTTSLAATSAGVTAPASTTASATASRSGGTHRSRSSSVSGSGNVSATGPGPVDGALRDAADLGRDGARLQQPQLALLGDRPLDVLRAAEDLGDRLRQSSQPAEVALRQVRTVALGRGHDRPAGVEHGPRALDQTADERFGPAADG